MGFQFERLPLTVAHLGLLWQKYRDRLPQVEERPPLEPVVERFGVRARPLSSRIALLEQAPPVRLWFSNTEGDELVQVQPDRFIFNWRRRDDGHEYPRYQVVLQGFESALEKFVEFLREQNMHPLTPTQCDVTYVNHIFPVQGVWSTHAEVGNAVSLLAVPNTSFLPRAEDVSATARYVMTNGEGETPLGRLHVSVEPRVLVQNNQPLIFLQLAARGRPLGEGLEGVRAFVDLGRRWIVEGFADITTPDMHDAWGRR